MANKKARLDRYEKMTALQKEAGTSLEDYGFKTPALLGIQTSKAAKRVAKKSPVPAGIGAVQKAISNVDYADQEDFDPYEYARKSM